MPNMGSNQSLDFLFLLSDDSGLAEWERFSFFTCSVLVWFGREHFMDKWGNGQAHCFIIWHLVPYKDENDCALFFVCNQSIFQCGLFKSPSFPHESFDSIAINRALEFPFANCDHDLSSHRLSQRRIKESHNDWRRLNFESCCKNEFWSFFGLQSLI